MIIQSSSRQGKYPSSTTTAILRGPIALNKNTRQNGIYPSSDHAQNDFTRKSLAAVSASTSIVGSMRNTPIPGNKVGNVIAQMNQTG
jgi:hypothetical protein